MTINKEEIRNKIMQEASEKAEKHIADEIMKEEVLNALNALNIAPFTCGAGYMHTYGANMHVDCIAETLSDAILIAERMNPLPMYLKREGGTSFLPDGPELRKRAGNNKAWQAANPEKEPELVNPYAYKIDGLLNYKEEKTLFFFIDIAGYRVRCDIEVKNDKDTRRNYRIKSYVGGIEVENLGLKNDSGHFSRYLAFWSSGEHPRAYIAY